jgi:hypothetical protein
MLTTWPRAKTLRGNWTRDHQLTIKLFLAFCAPPYLLALSVNFKKVFERLNQWREKSYSDAIQPARIPVPCETGGQDA